MSAFRDLLTEAEALGVSKLVFEVEPQNYREDNPVAWRCRASIAMRPSPVFMDALQTTGRTGEEALRHVVDFLKRVS